MANVLTNPAASQTIAQPTGTCLFINNLESVLYADQFASGSNTGGIAEAYAAGSSDGVKVVLGADITIASAQTLTLTTGKPLFLDLSGRTISFSHTSGVGLLIYKPDANPRYPLEVANGTIAYTGSSNSVTGIQVGDASHGVTNVVLRNLTFNNFSTTGAVALNITNVEDSSLDSIGYNQNSIGLELGKDTNQVRFSNQWFQKNVNCVIATDVKDVVFENCLFQSATGTTPFQIIASSVSVFPVRIAGCWFENSGDGTSSARQILFNAASGLLIGQVIVENCYFQGSSSMTGANGYVYGVTGLGTLSQLIRIGNYYNDFAGLADSDFTGDQQHFSVLENYTGVVGTFPVNQLSGTETTAPDALTSDATNGHLLLGSGNISTVFGQYSSAQSYATWIQARNRLGVNNSAYNLALNPLGGDVGINNNAPAYPLDVVGDINTSTKYRAGGAAGISAGAFSSVTAIQTTGGIVTTLTGTSDERLKTDIQPFERGLEAILAIKPRLYKWNATGQKKTGFGPRIVQAGFIAQNVQKAIPEAVSAEG